MSEKYLVESAGRVFMPSKITNRTDRVSLLLKFNMIEAIQQNQLSKMNRKPKITKSDKKAILRPYTIKKVKRAPFYAMPP